jgi:hypothetical protein
LVFFSNGGYPDLEELKDMETRTISKYWFYNEQSHEHYSQK